MTRAGARRPSDDLTPDAADEAALVARTRALLGGAPVRLDPDRLAAAVQARLADEAPVVALAERLLATAPVQVAPERVAAGVLGRLRAERRAMALGRVRGLVGLAAAAALLLVLRPDAGPPPPERTVSLATGSVLGVAGLEELGAGELRMVLAELDGDRLGALEPTEAEAAAGLLDERELEQVLQGLEG